MLLVSCARIEVQLDLLRTFARNLGVKNWFAKGLQIRQKCQFGGFYGYLTQLERTQPCGIKRDKIRACTAGRHLPDGLIDL